MGAPVLAIGHGRHYNPAGMRILFITSTRIGDAVLSSGLLDSLVDRYPGARFTIACGPLAAPLFEAAPRVDAIVPLRKRRGSMHWFDLWARSVGNRWHTVVDLRRTGISYFLRVKYRRLMAADRPGEHKVEQYGRALKLEPPPAPHLWLDQSHRDTAARVMPDGGPILALGPTANWPGKEWPGEDFAELARRLTEPGGLLPGGRVAIFSAPHERERALRALEGVPAARRIDLAGSLDLLTVFACLKRSALFVGNDSGLMHMAAAADVPTLGLFGPSRPELYRPWGERAAFVRTPESFDEIVGSPGYDHRTTGSRMGSLTVDHVMDAVGGLWTRVGSAAA